MSITPHEEAHAELNNAMLPVGVAGGPPFAQTFDRRLATSTLFGPSSGVLTMTAIWLPAGQVVSGISFCSGAAESGGSALWFALYKSDLTFMAQGSNEGGAAAFAINTLHRQALSAPQTCPYTGLYYIGFCYVGASLTLLNATAISANANGNIAGMTPIIAATSTGSLTTTAPSPAGALTAITQALWACVD